MLLRGGFRHQQKQQQGDGLAVGGVERDRLGQTHERGNGLIQAFHSTVRHGYALTECRRAQALAREQAVEHGGA